jgi:hypothetical protein
MKKIIVVFLSCFVMGLQLMAQSLNCEKFKNGTFKMTNNGLTAIIKRSGLFQTEEINNPKVKLSITYAVKWIDGCTYTLTPTDETLKRLPAMPRNTVLTVKIIKVSENSYTQQTTANTSSKILLGEMIKI